MQSFAIKKKLTNVQMAGDAETEREAIYFSFLKF